MTTQVLILSALLLSALLTIFVVNGVLNARLKGKVSAHESPMTLELIRLILFFSGGILLTNIVPAFQAILNVLPASYSGSELLVREISYFSVLLAIVLLTCLILVWLSSVMFSFITKGKNIFIEVANNNINAWILFAGILLALTFAANSGLAGVLDSIIPYPSLPIYR